MKKIESARVGVARAFPAPPWILGALLALAAGCGGDEFSQQQTPQDAGDASSDVKTDGPTSDAADAGCGTGFKLCSGKCVASDDPATGCAAKACDPCALPHATASCSDTGACAIATCDDGFEDCDKAPANGCEGNLQNDPDNCAECGTVCPAETATAVCEKGVCGLSDCKTGKGDCNHDLADGCEIDLTSNAANCEFCGNKCDLPYATEKCQASACVVESCDEGRGNCNNAQDDGCETVLATSTDHCGECGKPCTVGAHATPSCVDSKCTAKCAAGYGDCNGDPEDGCEVDVSANAEHCGACNAGCKTAHVLEATCAASACAITTCEPGWGNCDGDASNGCESNLKEDPAHCNSCQTACAKPAHAAATCTNGACGYTCDGDYFDCDNDPLTGCEVDLAGDKDHCGACGTVCTAANGTPGCVDKACVVSTCNIGFRDCNLKVSDGCEINSVTDAQNCGQCGAVCYLDHASGLCAAGVCAFTCAAPWADCDGAVDSCSINTSSNMDHCGGCGQKCDPANTATKSCTGGKCTIGQCSSGFANCNGQVPDGCEVYTPSDPLNCGGCGNECEYAHATPLCSAGTCSMGQCLGSFRNCDDSPSTGCEVDIMTSLAHCGACKSNCDLPHASESCVGGTCTMVACEGAFVDCDKVASNGCEAVLATDDKNCGACGHDCLGGTCTGGRCNPVVVASGLNKPWSVAVDATHIYWSTYVNPGLIQRIPLDGSGTPQNLASAQQWPNGIAINSTNIYWANEAGSTVYMAKKDGTGTPAEIWSGGPAMAVAATDAVVVWDTWGGAIWRANVDGTNDTQLVAPAVNQNPNRIATDGANVWWAAWTGDQIRSVPTAGGVVTTIASAQDGATTVVVDGTYVFWTTEYSNTVMRAPKAGGTIMLMSSSAARPIGLAVDPTWLYFAGHNDGTIYRMLKAGNPQAVESLANSQFNPAFMAVDSVAVYWANYGNGTIMRLRLP